LAIGMEETKELYKDSSQGAKDFIIRGPKQVKKIENPWIDKAIHDEVLQRKKVDLNSNFVGTSCTSRCYD
jgi:hypothetical protein